MLSRLNCSKLITQYKLIPPFTLTTMKGNSMKRSAFLFMLALSLIFTSNGWSQTEFSLEAKSFQQTLKYAESGQSGSPETGGDKTLLGSSGHSRISSYTYDKLFRKRLLFGIEQTVVEGNYADVKNFRFLNAYLEIQIAKLYNKFPLKLAGDIRLTSVAAINNNPEGTDPADSTGTAEGTENEVDPDNTTAEDFIIESDKVKNLHIGLIQNIYQHGIPDENLTINLVAAYGWNSRGKNTKVIKRQTKFDTNRFLGVRIEYTKKMADTEDYENAYVDFLVGRMESISSMSDKEQIHIEVFLPVKLLLEGINNLYLHSSTSVDRNELPENADIDQYSLDNWKFALTFKLDGAFEKLKGFITGDQEP